MSKPSRPQVDESDDATQATYNRANSSVAIFAGNSRVHASDDGSILVEPQIKAFEAALSLAREIRARSADLPKISIAFDHQGIFRLQFLADGLTNSQKRNPRLAHLNPRIVEVFTESVERFGISLTDIRVIHEDSARQHAMHVISAESHPEALLRRMISLSGSSEKPHGAGCSGKLTCAVITKEYFEKASDSNDSSSLLEVFFEDSPWSRDLAYVRGLQLSHLLGVETAIRLNLVNHDGSVTRGQIIESPKESDKS